MSEVEVDAERFLEQARAEMRRGAGEADFTVYAAGPVFCSVCTTLDPEAAAVRLNAEHPAGTKEGWGVHPKGFRDGQPNPCPCDTHPETHRHMLFSC